MRGCIKGIRIGGVQGDIDNFEARIARPDSAPRLTAIPRQQHAAVLVVDARSRSHRQVARYRRMNLHAKNAHVAHAIDGRPPVARHYAEAKGRLIFAGEHASPAYFGYMEGALQSGLRAAQVVAKESGLKEARRLWDRRLAN
jgi:uncharacterized protein with NAD-binding domain and iron-sulfur cluster